MASTRRGKHNVQLRLQPRPGPLPVPTSQILLPSSAATSPAPIVAPLASAVPSALVASARSRPRQCPPQQQPAEGAREHASQVLLPLFSSLSCPQRTPEGAREHRAGSCLSLPVYPRRSHQRAPVRTGVRSCIADPVCPSGKSHQRAPVSTRGSPPPSRAPIVLCKSRSPLRAHKAGPARPPPPPALPAPAPRSLSSSNTQTGLCPAPGPVAGCGLCGSPQATARHCAFRGPALRPLLRGLP